MTSGGRYSEEINQRITEARSAAGALSDVWKTRRLSREAKVWMYDAIVEVKLLYDNEVWEMNTSECRGVQAAENFFQNICRVKRIE